MTKTLTIKEDVYRKLLAIKRADESFSDLVTRLIEESSSTQVLKKLRGSVVFKDKEGLLLEISARRVDRRV